MADFINMLKFVNIQELFGLSTADQVFLAIHKLTKAVAATLE